MFKKWFCHHEWNVLVEIVQHKLDLQGAGFRVSGYLAEIIMYGKTKVIFNCVKCGKIEEKEYIGEPK